MAELGPESPRGPAVHHEPTRARPGTPAARPANQPGISHHFKSAPGPWARSHGGELHRLADDHQSIGRVSLAGTPSTYWRSLTPPRGSLSRTTSAVACLR